MLVPPAALGTCCFALASAASAQTPTQLVSVSSSGVQVDQPVAITTPALSDDGRFVAFQTAATNLVAGDTNGFEDVYLRDRLLGTTELVSRTPLGSSGNGASSNPSVSDDGRYVTFSSVASDLVANDTNGASDVFLLDRATGVVTRVSELPGGVSASGASFLAQVSGDGRFVAFSSEAPDLVANDSNGETDAFVRDLATGVIERVSVATGGAQAQGSSLVAGISDDGSVIAFVSSAGNLWPQDANVTYDAYVHDRTNGTTELASRTPSGAASMTGLAWNAAISGDGSTVVFQSNAVEFEPIPPFSTQVFAFDRASRSVKLVSKNFLGACAALPSTRPSISDDARFVAFESDSKNLVNLDLGPGKDVYVVDRTTGEVTRGSMNVFGTNAVGGDSYGAALSGLGTALAFASYAYDMVGGDSNGVSDVFVHDTTQTQPVAYCTGKVTTFGCSPNLVPSGLPSLSQSSGFVLTAEHVPGNKSGIFFYGRAPLKAAFQGGTLCVAPPHRRSNVLTSSAATACSGVFLFDFNGWLAAGNDPSVIAGDTLYGQFWFRDPPSSFDVGFTDAVRFVVYP
ncbi:MAG: hypothetical protein L6Q99_11885 [Planctomycetes bacterium]|nr:hypothetical protein [Planctomycetota bacterium]